VEPTDAAVAKPGQDSERSLFNWQDADRGLRELVRPPAVAKELRVWFAGVVASWDVPRDRRLRLFDFMEGSTSFALKVLLTVMGKDPKAAARSLIDDSSLFRSFFRDHPERIHAWFSHFHADGKFYKGAVALERYSLAHREAIWDRMKWKYSTTPSPVVIVHQRVRFLELDVLSTVETLLERVPGFWSSDIFRESVEAGEFLSIDAEFWAEELLRRLSSRELSRLVQDVLGSEPMKELAPRLMLELRDEDLLQFCYRLFPTSSLSTLNVAQWVCSEARWSTVADLMLYTVMVGAGAQLLRLLREPEQAGLARGLQASLAPRLFAPDRAQESAAWERQLYVLKGGPSHERGRFVAVECFLVRYVLCTFFAERQSLEIIMRHEGIKFEAVTHAGEEDIGHKRAKKRRKKHKQSKKGHKKRSSYLSSSSSEDEDDSSLLLPLFSGWRLDASARVCSEADTAAVELPERVGRRLIGQLS
jgi:hypothetical protein